jgi:hypothetical protein
MNSQDKLPYVSDRVGVRFRKVLKKAVLAGKYSHNNFRDSVVSICSMAKVYTPSIDAVIGHDYKKAQRESYVSPEVNPFIAKDACEAVADYYFPKNQ